MGGNNQPDNGDARYLFIAKVPGSISNSGLDPLFGSGGSTINSVLGNLGDAVYGQIVFDSSDNILQTSILGDGPLNFIRYTPGGNVDSDFSNNDISGVASIDIGDPNGETIAIAFDTSNNKTILCGNDASGSVLARFNMYGLIDTSFGVGGVVKSVLSDNSYRIFDMNLDSQQRIVLLGGQDGSGIYVARYEPSGVLDSTWGGIGGGGISGEVYFNDVSGIDANCSSNNIIAFDNSDNILILNAVGIEGVQIELWTNVFKLSFDDGHYSQLASINHPSNNPSSIVAPGGICFDNSNNKFLVNTIMYDYATDTGLCSIRRYTLNSNLDTTLCPSCTPAGVISYSPTQGNYRFFQPFDIKMDHKDRIIVCGEADADNDTSYPYVARFFKA